MYAKKLTKEMLIERGIMDISKDGKHIYGKLGVEFKQSPSCTGHLLTLGMPVHRIVYAWFNGEATEGLVVDHINNIKTDNRPENLQLLTSGQNIWKNRECNMNQLKCKMNKPRSFYENKLNKYTEIYEEAKQKGNAELAHKYRSYIANTNARLRYWDEHKDEYVIFRIESIKLNTEKEEMHRKAQYKKEFTLWKKYFKSIGNKAMWRQLIIIEKDYWNNWSADKIQEKLNLLVNTFPDFEKKFLKKCINIMEEEQSMNKETQIKKIEEELESDDSPVFIINENNPMAGLMEMFIKEQLWMSGYDVEEINEAWENGNIEADGYDFKIIKGKENK